jgi:hypothetical protein
MYVRGHNNSIMKIKSVTLPHDEGCTQVDDVSLFQNHHWQALGILSYLHTITTKSHGPFFLRPKMLLLKPSRSSRI